MLNPWLLFTYMQVLVVLFTSLYMFQIITIALEICCLCNLMSNISASPISSAVQTKPVFENMENQKTY